MAQILETPQTCLGTNVVTPHRIYYVNYMSVFRGQMACHWSKLVMCIDIYMFTYVFLLRRLPCFPLILSHLHTRKVSGRSLASTGTDGWGREEIVGVGYSLAVLPENKSNVWK